MRHRLGKALVALTISSVLIGGGTAIAHAANASPSAKASSTSSKASPTHTATKDNCPDK